MNSSTLPACLSWQRQTGILAVKAAEVAMTLRVADSKAQDSQVLAVRRGWVLERPT